MVIDLAENKIWLIEVGTHKQGQTEGNGNRKGYQI